MKTATIKGSQGGRINIPLTDYLVNSHLFNQANFAGVIAGQFEDNLYNFYFQDKKDQVILDIGANIGLFSMHVSDCSSKIYAIEPTPSHFDILKKVVVESPQIEPLNYALCAEDGDVDFFLCGENTTMNSIVNRSRELNKIKVKGVSLKTLIKSIGVTKIDFCKIDIEGSEYSAITSDAISYAKDYVDNFFIETHEVEDFKFDTGGPHFKQIFESNGYSVNILSRDSLFASKQ